MDTHKIKDKILITGEITLLTGMHIGASNDFSPIGAVDSVVVRDPLTRRPIIPGSSLKGKMRTLLAKSEGNGLILNDVKEDSIETCRLFGISEHKNKSIGHVEARLQFYDLFMKEKSVEELKDKTDLYLTEIKFENTINRKTAVANPRQQERVPAGATFEFKLIYNLEQSENNASEIETDFSNLAKALKLLQVDYLGGSGSRGYGKVAVSNLQAKALNINGDSQPFSTEPLLNILKGAEEFGLLPA
jgi:CRISPR-associated protein Csm3